MKTFYKWFDYCLNLFVASTFIATVVFVYFATDNYTFASGSFGITGAVITILTLISFVFSFIYVIFGIVFWVVSAKNKNAANVNFAKGMFLKGIIRSVLSFVLFFFASLVLSFFGPSLPGTHMPVLRDPNSPDTGFPIKDLRIIHKNIDADDSTECDITIQNTNASLSAANISVMDNGSENDYAFEQDHILPGKTDEASVSGDNTTNPCNGSLTIHDAGIVKK